MQEGEVVAGFIYVFFKNEKSALDFSKMLNGMMDELNYYRHELKQLRKAKYNIDDIIGNSPAVIHMKKQIQWAANSTSTVLIEGETGCGKELVAHSIHDLSERAWKPLVKINCAAIPAELFESELFGHEEGSFTGARKGGRKGKFEFASSGSLFLDEINQMPLVLQPKLLRALQEKEIERIGGRESIPVDLRLIVASNVSLEKMVQEKTFRSDLFYRLNVINIKIPPLRERKEDIPMLANAIMKKLNFQLGLSIQALDDETIHRFQEYEWPGNIRELQNVMERGMNMALSGTMTWEYFEEYFKNKSLRKASSKSQPCDTSMRQAKKGLEKDMILKHLDACKGNKTRCAKQLGISRTLLYQKMKQYGID